MQSILLLLPVSLISPTSPRQHTKLVRAWLLHCHTCVFYIMCTMSHQFFHCGVPTLLWISCSTASKTGRTSIYLKENLQWNNRERICQEV
ncbi:hypothetical protein BDZ91DRAFT_98475 [Kalaharituber pfeilii]|nr:hypothetical protein BDZ91DRAFT_98475 [Kalaharituber pfeilii]